MSQKLKFPDGWRELSIEDRGLLFTLAASSKQSGWAPDELPGVLGVDVSRSIVFVEAAVSVGVMSRSAGILHLVECAGDSHLRMYWDRCFDEVFWPAVTTPWKKLGRANTFKVWRTKVFGLIKPKTEEAAADLLKEIMDGVERYKQLLLQPNAPAMKYTEGWLAGLRWRDELDHHFIERHGSVQAPVSLSPLARARRHQVDSSRTIDADAIALPRSKQLAVSQPEQRIDDALPEFDVAL
jgi:hypothetical protein